MQKRMSKYSIEVTRTPFLNPSIPYCRVARRVSVGISNSHKHLICFFIFISIKINQLDWLNGLEFSVFLAAISIMGAGSKVPFWTAWFDIAVILEGGWGFRRAFNQASMLPSCVSILTDYCKIIVQFPVWTVFNSLSN